MHMAKDHPPALQNIFPALRYQNGPAALDWLARAFGFEKQMVVPGPEGTIAHAQMKLGPGVIMLGSGRHAPGTDNPWDTVKQGVYVCVQDVYAHYARAKAAGAEMELEDTDYGSRGYSVRDLEGHLRSFGTYRPETSFCSSSRRCRRGWSVPP